MIVGGTLQAVAEICDCCKLGSGLKGSNSSKLLGEGTIGTVSSSWLAALCKRLLCLKVIGGTLWLRAQTRSSSCLAAG